MGQLDDIFNAPVNLRKLISKISFDAELLEKASLEQPGLYLEASRYRTLKMRKKNKAFVQKDMVKAELGIKYRKRKGDGEKLTEGAAKDRVLFDPAMQEAQAALDRATEEEVWAQGLVEVFRQRLSVLKIVAEIRNSEMANEIRHAKENMATAGMRKAAEQARSKFDKDGEDEE